MKKSRPLTATLIVLLAACTPQIAASPGDPRATTVDVVNNSIVVDQEPIYVSTQGASIIWRVPTTAAFRFPDSNAITFTNAPEGEFRCNTNGNGRQVVCVDRHSRNGTFKYTIRLQQEGRNFEPLDPNVVNN
jgi:hypothetical protein